MDKDTWDERYHAETAAPESASLLRDYSFLLTGGKALDVAMGPGHNAVFLASHGYDVEGVDISPVAVSRARELAAKSGVPINAVEADLSNYSVPEQSFDLIINFYYLDRELIPQLKKGLIKNGLIFFETYTIGQRQFGKPSNPDYLLRPNELLLAFLDFFIIFYHERIIVESTAPKAIASLIAQKVRHN